MNTSVRDDNPFGLGRQGYGFEVLRGRGSKVHLDFGCFDGQFLKGLTEALADSGGVRFGADVNQDALITAQKAKDVQTVRIGNRGALPFKDDAFDIISCLDVLEHLPVMRQEEVLLEFWRTLSEDGLLIISVPRRHFLSVLDTGNMKFRFSRLHEMYINMTRGRDHYRERYVENPFDLVGDISSEKRWHQHFGPAELTELVSRSGFRVTDMDGSGLFIHGLVILSVLVPVRPVRLLLDRLKAWDAKVFSSATLFMTCEKR